MSEEQNQTEITEVQCDQDIGQIQNTTELKKFYEDIYQDLTKDFEEDEKAKLSELKQKIENSDNLEDKAKYYQLLDHSIMQKYEEEKKSEMTRDREIYWKRIDNMYASYREKFPLDYYLAQKKGEEIMSIDYEMDPIKFGEWRELNDWGKEVLKNVQFLGLGFSDLTDHDKESLRIHLKLENMEELEKRVTEIVAELD